MLTNENREQIRQLMGRYFQLVEERQFDEWVACYAEDGIHEADGVEHRGRAAIRKFIEGAMPGGTLLHLMGACTLDGDGQSASAVTAYATLIIDPQSRISLRSAGRYHDRFRLVDGRWFYTEHRNTRFGLN